MTIKRLFFLPLVCVLALSGCLPESSSVAGIEGTGSPTRVTGSVTAYGSVYVNGVHIKTDEASIYVDGEPATEEQLKLGMVLEVELKQMAEGEPAVAASVHYRRSMRGEVADVLEATDVRKVLKVLGQTLVVYDDVVFDGVDFDALGQGSLIDVSGFFDAQEQLIATRVAEPDSMVPEVVGLVHGLDPNAFEFELGELEVNYAGALFEGGGPEDLAGGVRVRLEGGEWRSGAFNPESVRFETEQTLPENGNVVQEGVIQGFDSLEHFEVNGLRVNASGAQLAGGEVMELGKGVRVVASGHMDSGVLQAEHLQLLLPGIDRLRGEVESVASESGQLTLLGRTYTTSGLTGFEDRARGHRTINLGDIRQGDFVELHTRMSVEGRLATRIKRIESQSEVDLRGPVTHIDGTANSLTVMGVEVFLEGADGAKLLAELARGDRVQVEGVLTTSDTIQATRISTASLPPGLADCPIPFQPDCEGFPGLKVDLDTLQGPRFRF